MRRHTRFLVVQLLFALFLSCIFPISLLSQEDAGGTGSPGWMEHLILKLNEHVGHIVSYMADILFADFRTGVPLIVVVLVAGGVYFSFFFGWMSIRGFRHAIHYMRKVKSKVDDFEVG